MMTRRKGFFSRRFVVAFSLFFFCFARGLPAQESISSEKVKYISSGRIGEPLGFVKALCEAALERTTHSVIYDGTYRKINYPGGDVPEGTGVCTDVVIRSYRALGIDLQKDVHIDMRSAFNLYPKNWGLKRTDSNIDHRRVPNLQKLFSRKGIVYRVTSSAADYLPGDLVTWMLPGNLPHIGIVTDKISEDGLRPLIVHNIGRGPRLEDMLFEFKITGHYRYYGSLARKASNAGKNRVPSQAAN